VVVEILRLIKDNKDVIIATAELFGIVVFLLWQVGSTNVIDVPQFIYANF
jgi:hypothetical protein